MAASSTTPSSLSAGASVAGKYLLVERIGEGGMGSVWRAFHTGLAREVAVKLVDLERGQTDERVERFLREARLCAAVRHRYVVDIFDVDVTPDGQPYMVMELLRGQTLAERSARPPSMPVHLLVHVLAQCLSGLGAVHRAGVVHRDLKPENIFLAEYHEGIVPKIVDFGVSRGECQVSRSGSRRLTRQGTVLGTPWYMSPEQARAHDDVGPQTDVYSMGVIAYEALSGRLPFDSRSLTDLLLQITTEVAPPLASLRPDLPPALSDVVAKAMERDREKRFRTALEMRAALLRAVEKMDFAYAAIVPSDATIVLPKDIDASGRPMDGSGLGSARPSSADRRVGSGSYRRGLADSVSEEAASASRPATRSAERVADSRPPTPFPKTLLFGLAFVFLALAMAGGFVLGRQAAPAASSPAALPPPAPAPTALPAPAPAPAALPAPAPAPAALPAPAVDEARGAAPAAPVEPAAATSPAVAEAPSPAAAPAPVAARSSAAAEGRATATAAPAPERASRARARTPSGSSPEAGRTESPTRGEPPAAFRSLDF